MTKEPTLQQWKRRALAAQEELAIIQNLRAIDSKRELDMARENAALRVALRDIQETSNWAYGMIADTLNGPK